MALVSCDQDDDIGDIQTQSETSTSLIQNTRAVSAIDYPTITEIKNSPIVKAKMDEAWRLMKSSASENGRSEYGFKSTNQAKELFIVEK